MIAPMTEITLKKYLEIDGNTQAKAAKILGCSQPAVAQMVAADRDIRFCMNKAGKVTSFYEIKKPKKRVA